MSETARIKDFPEDRRSSPFSNTKEHWHLSKGFNVGTMLTIIVMGVSSITYINGVAGDVEKIEEIQELQNNSVIKAIDDLKEEGKERYKVIQRQNERLEDKMDKIIDKVISVNGHRE